MLIIYICSNRFLLYLVSYSLLLMLLVSDDVRLVLLMPLQRNKYSSTTIILVITASVTITILLNS